jgi:hypothetical protein
LACDNICQGRGILTEARTSFWRRHRWFTAIAGVVFFLSIAAVITAAVLLHRAEPMLRLRIVTALADRFHARVELDGFQVSLAHGLQAEGQGLRIWPPAQVEGVNVAANGGDPLIDLKDFHFFAPLSYWPGKPFHISVVQLNGLQIHVPPRSHLERKPGAPPPPLPQHKGAAWLITFGLDRIECNDAHFVLETNKPGKLPLDFAIAHFSLTDNAGGGIHSGSVMNFQAELTNPKPVGLIHSTGAFGPWQTGDPGETPIKGNYTFDNANLASFKGIAGILSSTGQYQGTLRDLNVDGNTDTPDFRLTHFESPLPLHTHFHARVDATNGDTWLEPVDATLGHSHFTAQGKIVRVTASDPAAPGALQSKGHDIDLNVNIDAARIEDFLRLASKSKSAVLTGALTMKANLHIPPGPIPVHRRMELKGAFNLDQVRFTSDKIQAGITQLSMRGQGKPKDAKTADAKATRSTMMGNFRMANAAINLPALTYTVPGATIQLAGMYGVEGGTLDFTGNAKLQATLSQVVGGWAGFLLKPANKLFEKQGAGLDVPIHIKGTREAPKFGVDLGRLKSSSPQMPGQSH